MESCPGTGWWTEFQVNNTGTAAFDFMALLVTDTTTGTLRTLYSADFTNRNGCSAPTTLDTFPAGTTQTLSSAAFPYNPTGHRMSARLILCANPGPSGICITQTVEFTP
jgi:hypothetical protein